MAFEGGGGIDLATVIRGFGTFFGFFGRGVSDAMRGTITALRNGIVDTAGITRDLFSVNYNLLRDIHSGVIKPIFGKLTQWALWLQTVYKRFISPIVSWLKRITRALQHFYKAFIRPMLEAISLLRTFLSLTRLNQTSWGKALDDNLAKLSNEIAGRFLLVQSFVNGLASRVQLIDDQITRLLNTPALIVNLFQQLGALASAFWNDQIKQVTTNGRMILVELKLKPPLVEKQRELKSFIVKGPSTLLPDILKQSDRAMRVARGEAPLWLDYTATDR